jgi:hypothetical protein
MDAFDAALFDFVCDLDLTARVAEMDATPIPHAALRAQATPARRRRSSLRVLIPATSGAAAIAIGLTLLLVGGPSTVDAPALSATAQSRQLLTHADMLLTAASSAAPTDRTKLVAEAKADLTHVSRLLPYAVPQSRPGIREELRLLDERVQPLAKMRVERAADNDDEADDAAAPGDTSAPSAGGTAPAAESGDDRTQAPVEGQPPARRVPAGDAATTESTATSPPPSGPRQAAGINDGGTAPQPQPTSGTLQSQPDGGVQNTSYQQPPPDGAPRPRR